MSDLRRELEELHSALRGALAIVDRLARLAKLSPLGMKRAARPTMLSELRDTARAKADGDRHAAAPVVPPPIPIDRAVRREVAGVVLADEEHGEAIDPYESAIVTRGGYS